VRKSGEPYIKHPLEVAIILADLGFDEDVVSAGLLHDVVEDCGMTVEQIAKDFNLRTAELVDAVSAIETENYEFNNDSIFEDENFIKMSAEEQTFNKLIQFGKKNQLAFCIKFADRLHNLRTIGIFDRSKQLNKVRETEQWILPIAKILKAEYFYQQISNECFKIIYNINDCALFKHYDEYHNSNQKNIENIINVFRSALATTGVYDIRCEDILQNQVYSDITTISKNADIKHISQGTILKVSNYNIYLICRGDVKSTVNDVVKNMQHKITKIKIIDAKIDVAGEPYFVIMDYYRNKYRLYIMTLSEYVTKMIGTLDGQFNTFIAEEDTHNIQTEYIKVITRSGEIKHMPKDSTVLDFAFKIHKDIGFGFKYALINNGKTKFPPHTKLTDGDQVTIFNERDDEGNILNIAELKWLAYVNTDFAKKSLIKHFEKFVKKN